MNVRLYPWFKFFQSLTFWQAIWFLYFQAELSAAEAILLYAVYDIATTVLEVPSGYASDRLGRRLTLIISAVATTVGLGLLALGGGFGVFVAGQVLIGVGAAFLSGTDSALLYESLAEDGREDEIEFQELKAWRFSFTALAISAVTGGMMATWSFVFPFVASGLGFLISLLILLRFREPIRAIPIGDASVGGSIRSIRRALSRPVLIWLFALALLMYVFSHIPFVFGQPFILEALERNGYADGAPIVSGFVTAIMMLLSVGASLVASRLRARIGLPAILLFAFFMQIALIGVLALTNEIIAIAFLFLRMVPNALSQPFIMARIQPLLDDGTRATYLSLQSLVGRLLFSASLYVAAVSSSSVGEMAYPEIQRVLSWYVISGVVFLALLAIAALRIRIEPQKTPAEN